MEFIRIKTNRFDELAMLHAAYKAEIGEDNPTPQDFDSLKAAIESEFIHFYGCVCESKLVGICSICLTYSTFNYKRSGVFEDFYITPEYRHRGIARRLAAFACQNSKAKALTVGCADCDAEMYKAIGFSIPLGNLMAYAP